MTYNVIIKSKLSWAVVAIFILYSPAFSQQDKLLKRLQLSYLKQLHEAVVQLQAVRQAVSLDDGLEDFRAVLHCHSYLSHDSRGTKEQIIAAAKKAGVQVIMMSDHPQQAVDVVAAGLTGIQDGILFFPGTEQSNFLAYPKTRKFVDSDESSLQPFVDYFQKDEGLIFVAHPEGFMQWDLRRMTGMEIYNTHADLMEDITFLKGKEDVPLPMILSLIPAIQSYPQEVFAAIFDPPVENLKRWDEMNQMDLFVGIAGNDSHQNVGLKVIRTGTSTLKVEDALGEALMEGQAKDIPFGPSLIQKAEVGGVALSLQLDPYEVSFHYVSTHVLAKKLSEDDIREALRNGHAYVAFDWLADPTGFVFMAQKGKQQWLMGDHVVLKPGLKFVAESPLPCTFVLVKDGKPFRTVQGRRMEVHVTSRGVFRLEAHITIMEKDFPWIYTNPVAVH